MTPMKAHEVVMAWVTEELEHGRLSVGDHLPGERALAETLQVSRSSLRDALRVLEALGTINTSTGSGPRAGTIITAAPEQAFTLALTQQLATRHAQPNHVYEVRLLLESWAAEHAQAEAGDWVTAERLLDLMDDPALTPKAFLALDAQFHTVLSGASTNPIVSTLMEALRTSIAEHTVARAHTIPDWQRSAERLRREHRQILSSYRAGDRREATRLVRDH